MALWISTDLSAQKASAYAIKYLFRPCGCVSLTKFFSVHYHFSCACPPLGRRTVSPAVARKATYLHRSLPRLRPIYFCKILLSDIKKPARGLFYIRTKISQERINFWRASPRRVRARADASRISFLVLQNALCHPRHRQASDLRTECGG